MTTGDRKRSAVLFMATTTPASAVDALWKNDLRAAAIQVCEQRRRNLPGPDPASAVSALKLLIERAWQPTALKARDQWDLLSPQERFDAYAELYGIAANLATGAITASLELANLLGGMHQEMRDEGGDGSHRSDTPEAG